MEHPEWIATIIGALLCLVFSWFLAVVSRSQGVAFGKVSPAIGITGALVLAGMAIVGPLHVLIKEPSMHGVYTEEGYPRMAQGVGRFSELLSIASRATHEIGRRPTGNHVAWQHEDGKLEWVTKSKYSRLLRHKAKRAKKLAKGNSDEST